LPWEVDTKRKLKQESCFCIVDLLLVMKNKETAC
jgi:hypothetical protein